MNTPASQPFDSRPKARWALRFERLASLALGVILTVLPAPPTWAAAIGSSPSLADLSIEELLKVSTGTVTTASKRSERATAAPGTAIVVDEREIRLRGYANLKDVLRDLPGMETVEYYFSEIGTLVPVRGIVGNNKIIVLVNGMRVNPPGGEFLPLRGDFSVREAEQVEVIYGPGSTLYGPDAISAVINVKTKKPREGQVGQVGLTGGIHNSREAWASIGHIFDKDRNFSFTGYAQYQDSELMQLDKEYPSWWQDYRNTAAPKGSGTVPYRQDFGLNAFGRLEFQDTSVQAWYRKSTRSSAESGYPQGYLKEAKWSDASFVVEARNTLTFSEKAKLESAVTYNHYEIDPATKYVFPASPTKWFLDDFKYGRGQSWTAEETLKLDLTDKLDLLVGLTGSLFDVTPKATVPGGAKPDGDLVAQGGSFIYYTTPGDASSRHEIPRVTSLRYHSIGGYAEAGWRATRSLKLTVGVRLDSDSRFEQLPFTPRAAIIYDLNEHWTAKYIFTRAFVAPAPYFGYAVYDNGSTLATSNPLLEPETATSHEVNLSYTRKNFAGSFSLYTGEQNNLLLISDGNLPENLLHNPVYLDLAGTQSRRLVQTANGGSSRNIGMDLFGKATFGPVSAWASYSFVDFEKVSGGITSGLQGASTHNGRAGLTWAITSKLFVTPSLVIRSTPAGVAPGVLGRELQNPWEVNLHLLYAPTKHLEIFADLRNASDHKYALGGLPGQAVPQETIRAVLGVRLKF